MAMCHCQTDKPAACKRSGLFCGRRKRRCLRTAQRHRASTDTAPQAAKPRYRHNSGMKKTGQRTHWPAALLAAALLLAGPAQAELSMEQRASLIQPRATKLRQLLLAQKTGPLEIEKEADEALRRAEEFWRSGQSFQALVVLGGLQKYAPMAELPFIKVQLLLAAIAQNERNSERVSHHRAWAQALVKAINTSGDGAKPETAYRLVLASELGGWVLAQSDTHALVDQQKLEKNGRSYTLVQLKSTDATTRSVYFEVMNKPPAALRKAAPTAAARPPQPLLAPPASPAAR